jgi:enoyl-CoA hydratase/carnithine racemase
MTGWGIESGFIGVTSAQDVAVITLRRPDKLNALTADMRRELAAILRYFGDGGRARGIVLTGAGRAFCAGEDLAAAAGLPAGGMLAEIELFHDLTRAALETAVPVVAAVNGIAVGGAAEMTLCFDARIGTPAAEFLLPESNIGLTISNAASVLLPRLAGARAMRLVMESPRISATEALALGLLDEIVGSDGLLDAAIALIRRWTRPGAPVTAHLRLLRPPLDLVERAFAAETEAARTVEQAGLSQAGISRFLSRPRDQPAS